MTDGEKLSCEGYEFDGPQPMRNGRGDLMDGYRVRRLADNAEQLVTYTTTTFREWDLRVCKVTPSDGWSPRGYDGSTFMTVNQSSADPDGAEKPVNQRLWSVLWLRDGVDPMKFFPGSFLADPDADRGVVWSLLMEQVDVGIQRIERSRRDRSGKDTGVMLPEWAEKLKIEDITSLAASE